MPDLQPRFRIYTAAARAGIVLACLYGLAACGADDEASKPAQPEAESADAGVAANTRCPGGDALIARVRVLQSSGSDKAVGRWLDDIRAGAAEDEAQAGNERAGCASFATLNAQQTSRYVELLYNGPTRMAPALALHQTPAAQKAILSAYRDDPDAVSDNPGLAAAVAMAQIQQGKSYEAAYQDLAFAALNDGIDPGYVRGYLSHFGCGYEDAVWAAKSKNHIDFLAGEAFPISTSPADTAQSELVDDRMALLKQGAVPQLRAACPLSARYAAQHNGDTLTRLKLKAQQLSDALRGKLGDYSDMFAHEDDGDTPASKDGRSTLERFEQEMKKQYAALEVFARQSGELASARWEFCANRFDRGFDFDAVADCVKAKPVPPDSDKDDTSDKR